MQLFLQNAKVIIATIKDHETIVFNFVFFSNKILYIANLTYQQNQKFWV